MRCQNLRRDDISIAAAPGILVLDELQHHDWASFQQVIQLSEVQLRNQSQKQLSVERIAAGHGNSCRSQQQLSVAEIPIRSVCCYQLKVLGSCAHMKFSSMMMSTCRRPCFAYACSTSHCRVLSAVPLCLRDRTKRSRVIELYHVDAAVDAAVVRLMPYVQVVPRKRLMHCLGQQYKIRVIDAYHVDAAVVGVVVLLGFCSAKAILGVNGIVDGLCRGRQGEADTRELLFHGVADL